VASPYSASPTARLDPQLYAVDVLCSSCGASFDVQSTVQAISIDVCSNCHSAYTGRERPVASSSRIARFNRRRELAVAYARHPGLHSRPQLRKSSTTVARPNPGHVALPEAAESFGTVGS
jgi:large subunit ribosomal protein L31